MTIFEDYAILQSKIDELETKKESLRTNILEDMVAREVKKEVFSMGSFSVNPLKKWTFPQNIIDLEEKFKTAKEKAKSTGDATFVESPSLKFTPIKL